MSKITHIGRNFLNITSGCKKVLELFAGLHVGAGAKDVLASVLGEVSNKIFSRLGETGYKNLMEDTLLDEAKKIVVKNRNKLLNRLKLSTMTQGGDDSVTSFETRLKPVARTGKFQDKCSTGTCVGIVDFLEQLVLIRGLADEEIKRKILAMMEIECTLKRFSGSWKRRRWIRTA